MPDTSNVRLGQLHGRLGELIYQFTKVHFSHSPGSDIWVPQINAYRCEQGFAICVDLAGVPKESIQLEIESRKVRLHARQSGLLHGDGPPRRAAGACVLTPIRRMQAKAVGRSRRWGVFHFENGDYRKECQDPCSDEKQAQFTRLARPLSCS